MPRHYIGELCKCNIIKQRFSITAFSTNLHFLEFRFSFFFSFFLSSLEVKYITAWQYCFPFIHLFYMYFYIVSFSLLSFGGHIIRKMENFIVTSQLDEWWWQPSYLENVDTHVGVTGSGSFTGKRDLLSLRILHTCASSKVCCIKNEKL